MICLDSWVLLGILKMIPRICKFAKGQTDPFINRPAWASALSCLQVGCASELCWWSKGIDLLAPGLHFWLRHGDVFNFRDDEMMSDAVRTTPWQSPPPPGGRGLNSHSFHPVYQSMHALTQAPLFIVYRVLEHLLTRHRFSQHLFNMSSKLGTVNRK